jgi:hypothetical protein
MKLMRHGKWLQNAYKTSNSATWKRYKTVIKQTPGDKK